MQEDALNNDSNNTEEYMRYLGVHVAKLDMRIDDIEEDMCKDHHFIWKVNQLNRSRIMAWLGGNGIISEPFFSHKNGYKICLSVYLNGNASGADTHLSVYFNIMKGPNDDILAWPMKRKVSLGLINQETGEIYKVCHFDYHGTAEDCRNSFDKPMTTKNYGLGSHKFMELGELVANAEVCKNDQLFFKCSFATNHQ